VPSHILLGAFSRGLFPLRVTTLVGNNVIYKSSILSIVVQYVYIYHICVFYLFLPLLKEV
jgi:hypothetical protein